MTKKKIIGGLLASLFLIFTITMTCFGLFAKSGFSDFLMLVLFMLGSIVLGILCAVTWEIKEQF